MNSLTEYFVELHRREREAEDQLKKIRNAIKSGQEICNHKYKPAGNDSHYDYEECKVCGYRMRI